MIMLNITSVQRMKWSDGTRYVDWTAAESDSVRLTAYVRYTKIRD